MIQGSSWYTFYGKMSEISLRSGESFVLNHFLVRTAYFRDLPVKTKVSAASVELTNITHV